MGTGSDASDAIGGPPAALGFCARIGYDGCCEGDVFARCDQGRLHVVDCTEVEWPDYHCGWNQVGDKAGSGWYECLGPNESKPTTADDPSGIVPRSCFPDGPCLPRCGGRRCGPDLCGGSCGQCGEGELCTSIGQCVPAEPYSTGLECTGCCDNDLAFFYCITPTVNVCAPTSGCGWAADAEHPTFDFYSCGHDGAVDPSGERALECPFHVDCVPDCSYDRCGDDGCGGQCDPCPEGAECGPDGKCAGTVGPPPVVVEAASCGAVTATGCCKGETLTWCESGELRTLTCGDASPCGWDTDFLYYDCGTDGAEDPGAQHPRECPP